MTPATIPFSHVWCADFEFRAPDGERPDPLCMVAQELHTGRMVRRWFDQSINERTDSQSRHIGFEIFGSDSLFVSYYASAELSCFLSLGWPLPENVLDLCAEFKRTTSGLTVPCGRSLLGALSWYGLDGLSAVEKETMRALALRPGEHTEAERKALLDYCQTDVDALAKLLPVMLERGHIDLPRALLRGRYMKAAARIEWTGTPIDMDTLAKLRSGWTGIQDKLIQAVDADYGVLDGRTFKADRWGAWLERNGVAWPRLQSGVLDLSRDAFHEMGRAYPAVGTMSDLRHSLSELRLNDLAVGSDGRNRTLLGAFGSKTGRNQPSNSRFIFGPATWLRSLIQPAPGKALAYLDFEQQEFGIAAALSGDPAMAEAYRSSDPYLAFAKQAGAVPVDGTKQSHHAERERFKVCSLAVQYGMQADSLARRLGESPARARELLQRHRDTYPTYWRWSDAIEMQAMLAGTLQTVFGWSVHVGTDANPRSLRNFPLQGNGAEILRLACILATEAGIAVCAPIHDALLIEADADDIERVVVECQGYMRQASELVLSGFPLRTDAKIVRDRYSDPRGVRMWSTVTRLLTECHSITHDTLRVSPVGTPYQSNVVSIYEGTPHDHTGPGAVPASAVDGEADSAINQTTPTQAEREVPTRTGAMDVVGASSTITRQGAGGGDVVVERGRDHQAAGSLFELFGIGTNGGEHAGSTSSSPPVGSGGTGAGAATTWPWPTCDDLADVMVEPFKQPDDSDYDVVERLALQESGM